MKRTTLGAIDRAVAANEDLVSFDPRFHDVGDDGANNPETQLLALEEAGHLTITVQGIGLLARLDISISLTEDTEP